MGRKFLLKIDSMSLKYLFDEPHMISRKPRWLDFVREYHFELNHIKKKKKKFDALSRQAHMIYEVPLSQDDSDL